MQLHMNRGGSSRGINIIDTGILRIAPVAIAKRIRSGNLSFMIYSKCLNMPEYYLCVAPTAATLRFSEAVP